MHAVEQQAWHWWLAAGWPDTVNPSKIWFFSGWQYEPVEAAQWREAIWNATVKRDPSKAPSEPILASEARSWCEAEFTLDEAVPWFAVTDHYGDARTWQSLAFQPHHAAAYIAAATNDSPSPSALALWRQAGLSADQIVEAVAAGLALNEALDLDWNDPQTEIALEVLAALRRHDVTRRVGRAMI